VDPARARVAAEMGRVQLALNVTDLDEAISFYSKLFEAEPAKRRPGYANFAIANPPLKLVLFENPGEAGTLNHLACSSRDSTHSATNRPFLNSPARPRISTGLGDQGPQVRVLSPRDAANDGKMSCYAVVASSVRTRESSSHRT
jgi:catechol 2,3-dioxygenase-like lactoylglutathione lyase family enzyme